MSAIRDPESLHRKLYEAHWKITDGAQIIHDVLANIARDCRHDDDRRAFLAIIQQLSEAREAADKAWKTAAEARTQIILQTGCSGTCSS